MSTSRTPSNLGLLAIALLLVGPIGCAAGHPIIVTVAGRTLQSEALRDAARDAARLDRITHPDWVGARVVDTNAEGMLRLSESRLDSSIVAVVVLERTAGDEESLDRFGNSRVPVVMLDQAPSAPARSCVCAQDAGSDRVQRARKAIRTLGAALRESDWHGSPGDRARLAATLGGAHRISAAR